MLLGLLKKWSLNDELPPYADIIVAISYGATRTRLTHGSENVTREAAKILSRYLESRIFWGIFSNNPVPVLRVEEKLKEKAFPLMQSVNVGRVSSTTDECTAILRKLQINCPAGTHFDGNIVVVCEGSHSRRARLVWKHFFPKARLFFRSIDGRVCEDIESPMKLQRNWKIWLAFNILFTPFYKWWPGVGWFAERNFSQPT